LCPKEHSDNATKFTNGPFHAFFRENGIAFENYYVDTPQQNGRVERKNRQNLNLARVLIFQGSVPYGIFGRLRTKCHIFH